MMQISGSIYNSLKLMKLGIKWQQRKADPTKPKEDEEDPQRAQLEKHLQDQLESTNKSNILAAIDGKLKAGGELTKEELEYLKVHNPKLYEEAMEIKREREAYKQKKKNCKTKDEVERLNTNKLNQFLSQAKTISSNPNLSKGEKKAQLEKILRRVMGIRVEHNRFIQSKAYQDLPREEELREEKEKKKAKVNDTEQPEQEREDPFDRSRQASDALADELSAAFREVEQPERAETGNPEGKPAKADVQPGKAVTADVGAALPKAEPPAPRKLSITT